MGKFFSSFSDNNIAVTEKCRTFAKKILAKVLTFGKKRTSSFVLRSLNRTFAPTIQSERVVKKFLLDLTVTAVDRISDKHVLVRLTHDDKLPDMLPGQFVEVRIDGEPQAFLRRPISINFVDRANNELWLLVAMVGAGTCRLGRLSAGDRLNCLLPLGNGFTVPETGCGRVLLVGGGVGVAPLLYLGASLRERAIEPTFLLGARTAADLLEQELFQQYGRLCITTEDGSLGEKGFVTNHSVLGEQFDDIFTCGPTPMMKAVARYAREHGVSCQASLENMMACGLGACLCCVEKTVDGNLCVCKDGPVFDTRRLLWNA